MPEPEVETERTEATPEVEGEQEIMRETGSGISSDARTLDNTTREATSQPEVTEGPEVAAPGELRSETQHTLAKQESFGRDSGFEAGGLASS